MIPECKCGRVSSDGLYKRGRDCPNCYIRIHKPEIATKKRMPDHPRKTPKPKADCIHLGLRVNVKTGSCRGSYECEKGHGVVQPCTTCKNCADYQADDVV